MMERDNIHFTFRTIDGYNKTYNCVFCSRDVGKTTALELDKMLFPFLNRGLTFGYMVRTSIEIDEELIESIETRINRFMEKPIKFIYHKGEFVKGIVSLYLMKDKKKELCGKIISIGLPLQRLKKICIKNIHALIGDEYVCNESAGEKYVNKEALKIKELYNTLQRFAYKPKGLKVYLCGNPYSKDTPMIRDLNVDMNLMKEGARIVGPNYIVECYKMSEELKKYILERNPLYEFDDTYKKYAFDGQYMNDKNIPIGTLPNNYSLKFVFNMEGIYLGIFKNNYYKEHTEKYFVKKINFGEVRRASFCFEFDDLLSGSILMSSEERSLFSHFKQSIRKRDIAFEDVACYHMIEEIYEHL